MERPRAALQVGNDAEDEQAELAVSQRVLRREPACAAA